MRTYFSKDIAGSFEEILRDLIEDPDFVASPRGMEVKEIRDCSIEIGNPMMNTYINDHRSSPLKYIAAELLWYFSGTNDPTYIENYASLWKSLHNADGTVNSSYGNLLFSEENEHGFTQYNWVIQSLIRDKDTRQAFMHFNKPHHQYLENKDQVCTLQSLFHIRDNKLYMTLTMRSNDVVLGFMTDWAFFSVLHYHTYLTLKETYPELEMGSYTHISHSMHLYERHYDLVKKMIGNDKEISNFEPASIPLLSEPVVNEDGTIKEKYEHILEPIMRGEKPDYNQTSDNPLIQWCLDQLK
jgi:thymidylate synthase